MGVCAGAERPFAKAQAFEVGQALSSADAIGQTVQVVGRVAHAGSVYVSPFTGNEGVAIKIKTIVPSGGPGGGARKVLFTANCCAAFDIVDGTQVIHVPASDPCRWALHLQKTDTIFNIYRDAHKSCLYSGGDREGMRADCVERPDAYRFWLQFNAGKDAPTNMTSLNGKGMAGFGNRPRMAEEYVLKVGDVVSVLGKVKRTDAGLCFDTEQLGGITNMEREYKALNSCMAKQRAGDAEPLVLKMAKK